jgi:hypothetical protein
MRLLSWVLDRVCRPLIWIWYKSRNYRLVWQAGLSRSARVLEIGSGHNPWPAATELCDRFPEDNTERSGPLRRDTRPIHFADATKLPFPSQSFDFIYCSHVAEHIEDIGAFFDEIQRVGKAGFIETPNYLFEQSVGTTTHSWALYVDADGTLVAERKPFPGAPERVYHGWHRTLARHPLLQVCFAGLPELKPMQFWWKGRFKYRIQPPPPFLEATRSRESVSA